MEVTKKTFAFIDKHELPLYYVSASDGTNVVKVIKLNESYYPAHYRANVCALD